MPTAWRQADLLNPDDAVALGLVDASKRDTQRVMVISHSCDLARDVADEPHVELLIGIVVDEARATSRNGHSIGRLHLELEVSSSKEWVEYLIGARKTLHKSALLQLEPWPYRYSSGQRRVLQRWLAQRYARSEFPRCLHRMAETERCGPAV